MWPFDIFYEYLVHFPRFGMLYQEKSGNLAWECAQFYFFRFYLCEKVEKIWQTLCLSTSEWAESAKHGIRFSISNTGEKESEPEIGFVKNGGKRVNVRKLILPVCCNWLNQYVIKMDLSSNAYIYLHMKIVSYKQFIKNFKT
jgi:hypothetical protein